MKRLSIFLALMVASMWGIGQDFFGSSSYFMNPFSINPAYSAIGEDLFAGFQANKYFGSQSEKGAEYVSFGGYYGIGGETSFGLRLRAQSLGIVSYQSLETSLSYSAGIHEDHYISFTLAPGILRQKLEQNEVKYSAYVNQDDPLLNADNTYDRTRFTLGGGAVYNIHKFQVSFFMPYLIKGQSSLMTDFISMARFTYTNWKSVVSVENYGFFHFTHDGSYFYDAGLLVGWSKTAWLNLAYRSNKSLNAGFAIAAENFKFGYSYNHPFGEFNDLISSKHELTVTFSRENRSRRKPYFFRKSR